MCRAVVLATLWSRTRLGACPVRDESASRPRIVPSSRAWQTTNALCALSQRAAFEATHPAVLDAARLFADEPVLRAVDLGAADGVNSHTLIRDLARERVGRSLIYALVDLPTNAWSVAAEHLRHAFDEAPAGIRALVILAGRLRPGIADVGTSPLRLAGGPR